MTLQETRHSAAVLLVESGDAINKLVFGPGMADRQAAYLLAMAGHHLHNMIVLLEPNQNNGWISAFALARVSADHALRSLFLFCCQDQESFTVKFQRFVQSRPGPFGKMEDMVRSIRKSIENAECFAFFAEGKPWKADAVASTFLDDWGALNDLAHGGELSTRIFSRFHRESVCPDEVSIVALGRTTHLYLQVTAIVLTWFHLPQDAMRIALLNEQFRNALPDA